MYYYGGYQGYGGYPYGGCGGGWSFYRRGKGCLACLPGEPESEDHPPGRAGHEGRGSN